MSRCARRACSWRPLKKHWVYKYFNAKKRSLDRPICKRKVLWKSTGWWLSKEEGWLQGVTHKDVNYSARVRAELEQGAGLAHTEVTGCHGGAQLPALISWEVPVQELNFWDGKDRSSHALQYLQDHIWEDMSHSAAFSEIKHHNLNKHFHIPFPPVPQNCEEAHNSLKSLKT